MKPIARWPWLVAATLSLAVAAATAQDRPPIRQLRVAVVDPAQVRRESKWAKRLQEKLAAEAEQLRREQRDLEAQIQKQISDLKTLYSEGSREHDIAKRDLHMMRTRHEANAETYGVWMNRAQVEFELTVLQEIEREVQSLAAKWELDLVLRRQSETSRDQQRTALGRLNSMFDNPVLFVAKDLDITTAVISLLDNRMNASGAPVEASSTSGKPGTAAPGKVPDASEKK